MIQYLIKKEEGNSKHGFQVILELITALRDPDLLNLKYGIQ